MSPLSHFLISCSNSPSVHFITFKTLADQGRNPSSPEPLVPVVSGGGKHCLVGTASGFQEWSGCFLKSLRWRTRSSGWWIMISAPLCHCSLSHITSTWPSSEGLLSGLYTEHLLCPYIYLIQGLITPSSFGPPIAVNWVRKRWLLCRNLGTERLRDLPKVTKNGDENPGFVNTPSSSFITVYLISVGAGSMGGDCRLLWDDRLDSLQQINPVI